MHRDQVFIGDVLEQLKNIPDGVVQCCVTSPPYYGLRDYFTRSWFGGNSFCDHDKYIEHQTAEIAGQGQMETTNSCSKCGAWYGQLGLESTPDLYVEHLVKVFREVRRVLRDDGTLWLNLGDSYCSTSTGNMGTKSNLHGAYTSEVYTKTIREQYTKHSRPRTPKNMKPKDLIGIPWMVAFALRTDGWWLRSDIIWSKGNPMPESVTDRPTKSHEYVFLLTKNQDYFYDQEAIKEPSVSDHPSGNNFVRSSRLSYTNSDGSYRGNDQQWDNIGGYRNKRTVWTINPKPYKGAHFAVMPEELVSMCIKAGSSEKGCCSKCGAPWERITERKKLIYIKKTDKNKRDGGISVEHGFNRIGMSRGKYDQWLKENSSVAIGWQSSCKCIEASVIPCLILDPFAGSGTTLAVAAKLGRSYMGIELNPQYGKLIEERLRPAIETHTQHSVFDLMLDLPQE